jgi:hypothetical protein
VFEAGDDESTLGLLVDHASVVGSGPGRVAGDDGDQDSCGENTEHGDTAGQSGQSHSSIRPLS